MHDVATNTSQKSAAWEAFKTSCPIIFSNIPQGVLFAFLFMQFGYPKYLAPIMSLVVFAGMVQFMALTYMSAGTSIIEIALTATMLGARNSFYGLSFLDRYRCSFWKRCYLMFGLVDSTYSLLASQAPRSDVDDTSYCLWLTAFIHLYWVAGSLLGALFLPTHITVPGLHFVLIAFFTVLTIEQASKMETLKPLGITAVVALVAHNVVPQYMVLSSITVICIVLYWDAKQKFQTIQVT